MLKVILNSSKQESKINRQSSEKTKKITASFGVFDIIEKVSKRAKRGLQGTQVETISNNLSCFSFGAGVMEKNLNYTCSIHQVVVHNQAHDNNLSRILYDIKSNSDLSQTKVYDRIERVMKKKRNIMQSCIEHNIKP
ncbi:hypothetical protein ACJX0J_027688 [Zea mays]